jgi:uncharacterized protein (TIGR00251 family)
MQGTRMDKLIPVKVKKTGCKKTEIISENGVVELNVKGKPENGGANLEIIKFFSRKYKCNARIIRGLKSKIKVVKLLLFSSKT